MKEKTISVKLGGKRNPEDQERIEWLEDHEEHVEISSLIRDCIDALREKEVPNG